MSGLAARIRANVDGRCIATRIRKDGCSVSLNGVPSDRLIVDLDKPGSPLGQADARCDYLFVAEDGAGAGWVAPMELTRGRCVASKFVRQLRAGASAADAADAKECGGEIPARRRLWRRFTYGGEAGVAAER